MAGQTGYAWASAADAPPSGHRRERDVPVVAQRDAPRGESRELLLLLVPLTAAAQRYVKGGAKLPPPSATGEVFMIEAPQGLVECRGTYLSDTGCVPSSLGKTKRPRLWTVKLAGAWVHCDSRAQSRKCEPASAGAPGAMGTVE